ncbi:MAG TPA: cation diffusion facilitator family transporter [Solirubrobacteraceae bacterium]|jgi:cation diffusion facilitator family transporter
MRLREMPTRQRTALASVIAAGALVALKLVVGLAAHSLGLIAEAIHSGTDLVAALLTFFAVGVAARPADAEHPFGHGKAEHLSALGESAVLVAASVLIAVESIARLASGTSHVEASWYVLAVVVLVIAIDAGRALVTRRVARREHSPALGANALHFALDMVGSTAVLVGLILVRAGYQGADSIAALLVAGLVLFAAGRLMLGNVRVLMDSAPPDAAQATVRAAIESVQETVSLRRLRMREAGGRHFADVVIGVEPDAAVARGHAVASAIEDAIERELPGADVVVHVEPDGALGPLRQRATAAALSVAEVREVHNVTVLRVAGGAELALHMKVPGGLTLRAAHAIASEVENTIRTAVPEVIRVETHIEPLPQAAATPARRAEDGLESERAAIAAVVRELTGRAPCALRFRRTEQGVLAFLTLALAPEATLEQAHAQASAVEQRVLAEHPEIVDLLVHTEPEADERRP